MSQLLTRARLLSALLLLLPATLPAQGGGVDTPPPTPSEAPQAAPGAGEPTGREISLLEIAPPDVSALEPAVGEQLLGAYRFVLSTLEPTSTIDQIAGAFGDLGRLFHAYELHEPAARCYVNASRLAERDFRWPYLLGHVQKAAGRLEEAAGSFGQALRLFPGSVSASYQLGDVLYQLNRFDEAAAAFERVLTNDPGNPAATAGLGRLALARQDYAEAVDRLAAALDAVPEASSLHYELALAYRGMGEIERAKEHLARRGEVGVRTVDPLMDEVLALRTGERVHLLRGQLAFRFGRYADAAEEFRRAVEAAPESAAPRVNLGSALGQLGRQEEALVQYRRALDSDPDNVTALYNVGSILSSRGDDAEALPHLRRAVELAPADGGAHLALAVALRRTGELQASLEHFRDAVIYGHAVEQAFLGGAEVLIELARYGDALEVLDAGNRQHPESGRIAHALARLLAAGPDRALRDGSRALELAAAVFSSAETQTTAETVALALAESGRCAEAAAWLAKAAELAYAGGDAEGTDRLRQRAAALPAESCRP